MEIVMARSFMHSLGTQAKSFFVNHFLPQFSIFLSGIKLSFNYRMKDLVGVEGMHTGEEKHKWIEIQLLGVDILTIENIESIDQRQYYFHLAFLGFGFCKKISSKHPFSSGSVAVSNGKSRVYFDKRMVTIILSVTFITLLGVYFSEVLPVAIHTLLPVLLTPVGSLSVFQLLVCYRVFATLVHIQHGLLNILLPSDKSDAKESKWGSRLQPFIHPVMFLITVPFLLTATYPVVVTLTAMSLSSLLDSWTSFRNMVSFSWNMFCIHISLLGPDLRPDDPNDDARRGRDMNRGFHAVNVDTKLIGGKCVPYSVVINYLGISQPSNLYPYSQPAIADF